MRRRLMSDASPGLLILISCGIAFASYVGTYMRIPVVPLFAQSLGASAAQVGLINAAFLLTCGALSLPMGLISDRWGRRPLIAGGLLVSLITSLLLCLSTTPYQVMAIYLLFGAGLAAIGPTLMSYVADISPLSHLGRTYGWYTLAIYTGMSLGPGLGGILAQRLGFTLLFLLAAGFLFLIMWVVILWLPEIPRYAAPPGQRNAPGLGELWGNRALLSGWLATLAGCFAQGMYLTFAPLYAHQQGLSLSEIGFLFTVQSLCNAASRFPWGRLSDRVAHRGKLAALGLASFCIAVAGFGFAADLTGMLVASAALGLTMGLAFTPLGAFIAESVPPESRGLAMGGYNTCIYLGMMLSSAFLGGVVEALGFTWSFALTSLTALCLTGCFLILLKTAAHKDPEGKTG